DQLDHLRSAYYWSLIPGLLAVAIVFSVRENASAGARTIPSSFLGVIDAPRFRRYLFVWAFFSLVNSSDAFLLLKARQAGLSLVNVTLLYCFYNVVYSVASPSLGGLSDRVGRKPMLALGFAIFAIVYLGIGFANQAWQFAVLFGIYGAYMAATD